MSYVDCLNLTTVQVARRTIATDGMGGVSASTVLTTLSKAAIWQNGSSSPFLTDQKITMSTHTLACQSTDDVQTDDWIVYGGITYKVAGRPDNVMEKDMMLIVPIDKVE